MNDRASYDRGYTFPAKGPGVGVVAFLFGIARRTELPGSVLYRLLTDLGMTMSAARALVARMRREGQLDSVRHGRSADYRLAGRFLDSFLRVRDTPARGNAVWTGAYHAVLYQVPESHRAYRDALRRYAVLAGFGILQPGVLISLTDRTAVLQDLLDQAPDEARVYRTTLTMAADDAARAAWDAWDLGQVSDLYRDHIATLTAALRELDGEPPATVQTLRRFTELARLPFVDTLRDPGLPPELTPPDWPGPRLRALTAEISTRFGPAAHRYVAGLFGG